jgi:hypothetical protein
MIASEAVRFHTRVENFKFETEANATSLIARDCTEEDKFKISFENYNSRFREQLLQLILKKKLQQR